MKLDILTKQECEKLIAEANTKLINEIMFLLSENKPNLFDNLPELMKSHQVERFLKISKNTLYNYRRNGSIPFNKIGGSIFYNLSEVIKFSEKIA